MPDLPAPPPYVPGHGLLEGKGVLITAAAGTGIGSAAARKCLEEGARVVISDKHERRLGETAAELGVVGIPCDVTNEESVQALIAAAADELGGIDVLINNAGVIAAGPIEHMTTEDFAEAMAVHFWGPLYMTMAALPHMRRAGAGRIVSR